MDSCNKSSCFAAYPFCWRIPFIFPILPHFLLFCLFYFSAVWYQNIFKYLIYHLSYELRMDNLFCNQNIKKSSLDWRVLSEKYNKFSFLYHRNILLNILNYVWPWIIISIVVTHVRTWMRNVTIFLSSTTHFWSAGI